MERTLLHKVKLMRAHSRICGTSIWQTPHLVGWYWRFKMAELVPRCELKVSTSHTEAPSNTHLKLVNNSLLKLPPLVPELQVQAMLLLRLLLLGLLNDLQLPNPHNNHSAKDNRALPANHQEAPLPDPNVLLSRQLPRSQSQPLHSLRQMLSISHLTRRMRKALRLLMELLPTVLKLHHQSQRPHQRQ